MIGVVIYNRLQERATRREAQRSFGSKHADVLLETPPERREPTLEAAPGALPEPMAPVPGAPASDPRIDYVIEIHGAPISRLRSGWDVLQRRFTRRISLNDAGGTVRAMLQMVSRAGAVTESELLDFRARVESLAAAHGGKAHAPPVRPALEAAQALDRGCADVDVQIAIHVLGAAPAKLEDAPFQVAPRSDGLTLLLDVPRTAELSRSYAAMVKAAHELGGRLVDDNGNTLDERALSAIGVEVESLRARLRELGIEPGSPLALRVFS